MTTITLDVPDELANQLKKFDTTLLIEILRKVLELLTIYTPTIKPPVSTWPDDGIHDIETVNGQLIITDTVISVSQVAELYQAGLSAEQISHDLPLTLAQVHTAIAYYLSHQGEVKAFLQAKKNMASRASTTAFQQMLVMATDLGVADLAEQHDHYLYGVDKR